MVKGKVPEASNDKQWLGTLSSNVSTTCQVLEIHELISPAYIHIIHVNQIKSTGIVYGC